MNQKLFVKKYVPLKIKITLGRDRKIDKILTSKIFGFPIMILFLGFIFWITIVGANYPSQALFRMFTWLQEKLVLLAQWLQCPSWLSDMLISGVYQTLTWIISVMLPPMAIFFPLFTFLEDLGYLPRMAFNMDGFFKKCCCTGKQMITMCMGFGCNAAGCVGCRIIDSPRERLIAILTNNFVPCNGRFPFLISIATIFIAGTMQGFRSFYCINDCGYFCHTIRNIFDINHFKNIIENHFERYAFFFCFRTSALPKTSIGKNLSKIHF